jgi:N-acetylglucosaminyldiphosphoundecaprenol N-acetyl-beta-D-mannosaminyltransferase
MTFRVSNATPHPLVRLQASYEEARVAAPGIPTQSNLARPVYCVLGMPIDAVNLTTVVHKIEVAAAERAVLLISTPNLNFLVSSLSDPEFRESVLDSDLCPPDGTPIIWIARLLGLPIKERAAGADLLEQLQIRGIDARQLTVFLFGGSEGVAAAAARRLNSRSSGLTCVGSMNPGFCGINEMSQDHIIDAVNSSGADFLVVSLGAKKGQLWLQRNRSRLTIPIRSHLGAAINFQAGTIKRAPRLIRAWGFEWLWRIKEERYLWKRYCEDGLMLLRLLMTRVLPLAVITRWQQFRRKHRAQDLSIKMTHDDQSIIISLRGAASESHVPEAILRFQEALTSNEDIVIDLSDTLQIDARFLGLLLMLRKELGSRKKNLKFAAVPRAIERAFYLNELGFLLSADTAS